MGHLLSSRPQWTWLWDQGHGSAGRRGSEATTRSNDRTWILTNQTY